MRRILENYVQYNSLSSLILTGSHTNDHPPFGRVHETSGCKCHIEDPLWSYVTGSFHLLHVYTYFKLSCEYVSMASKCKLC